MSNVTGNVEAVSRKFEKFTVKVNDLWYGTKAEWKPEPEPKVGDNISFYSGEEGKKYLQNVTINSTASPSAAKSSGGYSSLGVELGHASNVAMEMVTTKFPADQIGSPEMYKWWLEHTENVYKMMKSLRARHELAVTSAPPVKVEAIKKAPVPEAVMSKSVVEELEEDIFA
jgi:hypothetical protein